MRLEFDWDPSKAESNLRKHRVSFEEAMSVFGDRLALSRLDRDHRETEERWVTVGLSRAQRLLIVIHTAIEQSEEMTYIRIISARRATSRERRQYEDT